MTGTGSKVITYTYNKANRLMSETTTSGVCSTKTYEYDASGNLTTRTGAGATATYTYTYDAYNRMAAATSGAVTTNYNYSGNGNRFSKKVGTAAATRHIWDGQDITYDEGISGLNQNYIHGSRGVEAVTVDSDVYGLAVNFHGDVTAAYQISLAGVTSARTAKYDAYGNTISSQGSFITNPYGFSGEYTDAETGFQYLRARYYDRGTGRFTQEDTVDDPNNFANLYLYCAANPVKYIDPSGHWTQDTHGDMTAAAFKWHRNKIGNLLKNKKNFNFDKALEALKKGSKAPDNKNSKERKIKGYHGRKSAYLGVLDRHTKLAATKFKKGKYEAAFYNLGISLHTIQDFLSHNVFDERNNTWVASYNFHKVEKSSNQNATKSNLNKVEKFFAKGFRDALGRKYNENTLNKKTLHNVTADNVNADFRGGKWVWTTVAKNRRYQDAIGDSSIEIFYFTELIK